MLRASGGDPLLWVIAAASTVILLRLPRLGGPTPRLARSMLR